MYDDETLDRNQMPLGSRAVRQLELFDGLGSVPRSPFARGPDGCPHRARSAERENLAIAGYTATNRPSVEPLGIAKN